MMTIFEMFLKKKQTVFIKNVQGPLPVRKNFKNKSDVIVGYEVHVTYTDGVVWTKPFVSKKTSPMFIDEGEKYVKASKFAGRMRAIKRSYANTK